VKKYLDTPKEKALNILTSYKILLRTDNPSWEIEAKDCALKAVDLILNDVGAKNWEKDTATNSNYWQDVRAELNAL